MIMKTVTTIPCVSKDRCHDLLVDSSKGSVVMNHITRRHIQLTRCLIYYRAGSNVSVCGLVLVWE